MKRNVKRYPDEFKIKVVKEYLETDLSQAAIMEKYDIRGAGCIPNWIRKFGLQKPSDEEIKLRELMTKETRKSAREIELEAKVRDLERALEYEQLRSYALDTLIDVAERDLKVDIRKKPGSKQ
jgi:transposase-like protein